MLDTREELINRATVWTLDEGRRPLYDEINGRVSPAGHARDYIRKDMADFALNCERELIAALGYEIQNNMSLRTTDEKGEYAQGYIAARNEVLQHLKMLKRISRRLCMTGTDRPNINPRQSGQSLLELHQIVGQRIAAITLETTAINTTTYADKSGTTYAESTKIILTFDNGTRCEIMQEVPMPTEI